MCPWRRRAGGGELQLDQVVEDRELDQAAAA
jgi:hypothetical protein